MIKGTWFQVQNNTTVAKLLLFLNITNIKPSSTHQKAGVSPRTSVQLRVNYQMVGVRRRKCKSVSWGVCTKSKICDTNGRYHSTKKQKFRERNQIIRLEKSRYISRGCPLFLKIPIQQKLKRPMLKDLEFSIVMEINIFLGGEGVVTGVLK